MKVLIPFLAGLLFGHPRDSNRNTGGRLNPLFGGSAFRTSSFTEAERLTVLIPFLAGLLFGLDNSAVELGAPWS